MDWAKVVTNPLGLGGFALSLVFGLLARTKSEKGGWLRPSAVALAAVALLGGLAIAYRQESGGAAAKVVSSPATGPADNITANNCGVVSYQSSGAAPVETNCDVKAVPSAPAASGKAKISP